MNAETVEENDQTPPHLTNMLSSEVLEMDENNWLELKNKLQDYLCRTEYVDYPTFSDDDMINWMNNNGDDFNQFYQEMKMSHPSTLIRWLREIDEDDKISEANFLKNWSEFKSSQPDVTFN